MSLRKGEGTFMAWAADEDVDWTTNDKEYHFGISAYSDDGVCVESWKHSHQTVEVLVRDSQDTVRFVHPIPECDERGLLVGITWKNGSLILYLNGRPAERKRLRAKLQGGRKKRRPR